MEFGLSETQTLLQDLANRVVRERYEFEQRRAILDTEAGFSPELWSEFAALGLLGVEIGEDFGGTEGDFHDLAVVLEAFGRGLVVEPFLPTVVLGAAIVARAGDADLQAALLPRVAAGEIKLALAHGEPNARYAISHVETRAEQTGDGYVLNGAKSVVIGGDAADTLIVSARTKGGVADRDGISLFLIDCPADGLHVRPYRNMDGRGAADLTLSDVRLPATSLIGAEHDALGVLEAAHDRAAAALCCEAIGAMTVLNEMTLEYLKTRVQFGRPIGKFQVLQHHMADMVIAEQQARSMVAYAVEHADCPDPSLRAKAVSAAKASVDQSAQIVGRGAIQLHGGIGMTMEYAAGHYFRRLTAIEKMFGDIDFHLSRFAAL